MRLKLEKDPITYLSGHDDRWTMIHEGLPLCDYKKTAAEALEVAKMYKLQPHSAYWNSKEGIFIMKEYTE